MKEKIIAPYTNNARLKDRYKVIVKFFELDSRVKTAKELNVSRRLVNEWVSSYLRGGFDALAIKKQSGRPSRLNSIQKKQLKQYIADNSIKPNGGRLMGRDVKAYIESEFDITYQKSNIYTLLHELNLSWISSRSRHPKQNEETQERFKKFPT